MLTSTTPAQTPDYSLLDQEIRRRTAEGWQIVSQTPEGVQFRQAKRWSGVGSVLFILLPLLGSVVLGPLGFGIAVFGFIFVLLDYLVKKDRVAYVTADELRAVAQQQAEIQARRAAHELRLKEAPATPVNWRLVIAAVAFVVAVMLLVYTFRASIGL